MVISLRRDSDPFKKYWWVALLVFGGLGGLACLPTLQEGTAGSSGASAAGEKGLKSFGGDSLDPTANPNGAPGGAVDLSMDDSGPYRKNDASAMSSLYQAPGGDDSSSSDKTAGANAGNGHKLADALRDITAQHAAASADPRGWGGQTPQRGFAMPGLTSGGLSGLGSAGGSGGTSFSGASPAVGGGFGNSKPNTGVEYAHGLSGDVQNGQGPSALGSLRSINGVMGQAVKTNNADIAGALGGRSFDGAKTQGLIGGTGGQAQTVSGLSSLSAAPINLKTNPDNLSVMKMDPPVPQVPKTNTPNPLIQMIISALIMGVMGAMFGGI